MTTSVTKQRAFVPVYPVGLNVTKQRAFVPIYAPGLSVTAQRAFVPIYIPPPTIDAPVTESLTTTATATAQAPNEPTVVANSLVATATATATTRWQMLVAEAITATAATSPGSATISVVVAEMLGALAQVVTSQDALLIETIGFIDATTGNAPVIGEVLERVSVSEILTFTTGVRGDVGETLVATDTLIASPGAFLREQARIAANPLPVWRGTAVVLQRLRVTDSLITTVPAALIEQVGVAAAAMALQAITVAERMGALETLRVMARLAVTARERVRLSAALATFFSGDIAEAIAVGATVENMLKAITSLLEHVAVTAAVAPALLVRADVAEGIEITAAQIVQGLYQGTLREGVDVTIGYTSPGSDFTTWAINTRTAAVTEYRDYAFNSFGRAGNIYLGASSDGLYELRGDTDAGQDIVATIRSGYMQFGGTRLSRLSAAYIAMRGEGEVLLKILTGDGSEYVYRTDTRNMRSTKVHMGKGQRARYFAFELVTAGQDFDLDTIEFVPVVVQRRV